MSENNNDSAFTIPREGSIPQKHFSLEEFIANHEKDKSDTMRSGNIKHLLDFLEYSDTPHEFYYNSLYECVCLPSIPSNEEEPSVILVFDKDGGFVNMLINNKKVNPEHSNRRHNLPENIREKIIMKCANAMRAYIRAYSEESPQRAGAMFPKKIINDEEKALLNDTIKNRDALVEKMGLRSFVVFVDKLVNPWDMHTTLDYMDRRNIS